MPDPTTTAVFDRIYDQTADRTLGFLTARCRDVADVPDLFQDTYTELLTILLRRGADYVRRPEALVMKLARQQLARYYAGAARRGRYVAPPEDTDAAWERIPDEVSVEDTAVTQVMLDEVRAALAQRPQDVQKIFYLFYALGHTIRQIAEELNMSESGVKHKLYRTLGELRKLYTEEGASCGNRN